MRVEVNGRAFEDVPWDPMIGEDRIRSGRLRFGSDQMRALHCGRSVGGAADREGLPANRALGCRPVVNLICFDVKHFEPVKCYCPSVTRTSIRRPSPHPAHRHA